MTKQFVYFFRSLKALEISGLFEKFADFYFESLPEVAFVVSGVCGCYQNRPEKKCDFFHLGANRFCSPFEFVFICINTFFISKISAFFLKMVKVSFNSALAQKEVKKDDESLIPEEEVEVVSRKWLNESCTLSLLELGTERLCSSVRHHRTRFTLTDPETDSIKLESSWNCICKKRSQSNDVTSWNTPLWSRLSHCFETRLLSNCALSMDFIYENEPMKHVMIRKFIFSPFP